MSVDGCLDIEFSHIMSIPKRLLVLVLVMGFLDFCVPLAIQLLTRNGNRLSFDTSLFSEEDTAEEDGFQTATSTR